MATTFAVPDGRVAMAATLSTGNGTAQTVNNAVNGISFTPDMVWNKGRSVAYNHSLVDVIRGNSNVIFSNTTDAEQNPGAQLDITTNGFISTYRSANLANNQSAATYVGWQWNAGGTTVTNGTGTISSQVRANTTAGFSVVTYTGTGANATVGHGLGVVPGMMIVKRRSGIDSWATWTSSTSDGYLFLNSTSAKATGGAATLFGNGSVVVQPTSTLFSIATDSSLNASASTYVAYCWAPVAGYSAFGSYTGNGSADGTFIYTGFRPRYVLIKRTDASADWFINDTSREPYNLMNVSIRADTADTEASGGGLAMDALSNGFKMRDAGSGSNASGGTYIYAAFAENPLKYANAR